MTVKMMNRTVEFENKHIGISEYTVVSEVTEVRRTEGWDQSGV